MSTHLEQQVQDLNNPEGLQILTQIKRGLEKESLRIDDKGSLAQTPHPKGLGSALTHSSITTDYSEALMEFITSPNESIEQSLERLADVHSYVYQHLDGEILWAASMPCIVSGDGSIPIAEYGKSNVAQMKEAYRKGLGHRYGRMMQAIAGIHYNFSMPEEYWKQAWEAAGQPGELADYISDRYLALIRNFHRYSWLLIYLYGASPAVCSSFLRGRDDHNLQSFDEESRSLHLPYGTALRMGDLGYNSDAQGDMKVCYNALDDYVETLSEAIQLPHPEYASIRSGQNGDYQQLNDSLLQIENEFYSAIRPKRVAFSGETPLGALRRGGIEYIEVRCVDVSPFSPVGLDAQQIRFMDVFLLYCLMEESPCCNDEEQTLQSKNIEAVVNRGRQPNLKLNENGEETLLSEWASKLLASMSSIAQTMDKAFSSTDYSQTLAEQMAKVDDPELTASARILREMTEKNLPFFRLAMEYSKQWSEHFLNRPLSEAKQSLFDKECSRSTQAQAEIEQSDTLSFDEYLKNFYAQYPGL
ncbi:MAG: glutamate--cysteine ligase [Halioglobus sp.]